MKPLLLIAALTFAPAASRAEQTGAEYPALAIGAPVPAFSLPGVDGKPHKLSDYSKAKVLAVVFQCNSCPVSQLYEGRIERLYQDYAKKGVALVAINPDNPNATRLDEQAYSDVSDSLEDMKIRAKYRHLDYPYLYDGEKQSVAMKYGPIATPQIFIFDKDRKLRYQGRIDDNMQESLVKSQDARTAIDAVLAGGTPPAASPAAGCSIKWTAKSGSVADAAAREDAAPVAVTEAGAGELKKLRANPTGKVLLVNFWATWCGPCIGEFPDLVATYRMYRDRGFDLITVSENDPAEKAGVLKFLERQHASGKNLVFASADTSAMQEAFDHNMGAAVPFTVVLEANGDVIYQEEGALDIVAVRRAILANLPDSKEYRGLRAYWSAEMKN